MPMPMDLPLENIIDTFTVPSLFTQDEEIALVDTAYSLINDLLEKDAMLYIQPYFHDYVIIEVTELLLEQLVDIISADIEAEVTLCVEQAMRHFYLKVAPKRSFPKTFIRLPPNMVKLREKIAYLQGVPQPEQRTPAWYNFRYKYLTASSIWKAFISESTRNQLIYDKCKPLNVEKYSHTSLDSPMHWGHKYEPVSIQLYESLYDTQVSDFGCIPHKTLAFLAASPDGINTLDSSPRYGRMLEIKNIVNRDIDGNPKMEYWIQMQLQMEVCNLNECDFFETRFKEYADEEAYLADSYQAEETDLADSNTESNTESDVNKTQAGEQKGLMIQFISKGQPYYEYAPLNTPRADLAKWEATMMEKHCNDLWGKTIYWRLDEVSCVLVLRNKFWFRVAVPILTDLWKTIEHEKAHGYEHRSPHKKVKLNNTIVVKKCLIDFSAMMEEEAEAEAEAEAEVEVEKQANVLTIDTEVLCNNVVIS
jgi:putative phage-type endonuclease